MIPIWSSAVIGCVDCNRLGLLDDGFRLPGGVTGDGVLNWIFSAVAIINGVVGDFGMKNKICVRGKSLDNILEVESSRYENWPGNPDPYILVLSHSAPTFNEESRSPVLSPRNDQDVVSSSCRM